MSDNDHIERELIAQRKELLRERYGALFSGEPSHFPPAVERAWLDSVLRFEAASERAALTTVRHFVGDPVFAPVTDIDDCDIGPKLAGVLEVLASNGVFVDFLDPLTGSRERYRFITEELLDEEIEDIRLDGLETHYLYEAYHPHDEEEVRKCGEEFLRALFGKSGPALALRLPDGECYDRLGGKISPLQFRRQIQKFLNAFTSFRCERVEPLLAQVEGLYATIEFDVHWQGLAGADIEGGGAGVARLRLKRSRIWRVIQLCLPGWNF